ncbi:MAG: hypothetical protein AB7O49_16120 [Sphingomonadales bacterium]
MGGFRVLTSWWCRVLLAASLFAGLPASAATVQIVPGVSMEVEAPAGQCLVEPSAHQFDAAYFATMQRLYVGSNNLLAYFIPCDALASLRQGVAYPLAAWTVVLLPLSGGQVMAATGYTRPQALDELAKAAGGNSLQGYLDGQKGAIESRVAQVIESDAYQMNQLKSLGVLARDEAGLYSGLLMTQMIGGQMEEIACVFGMTLVNGYIVTLNIYRPYVDPATFSEMVDDLKARMAGLVAANDDATTASSATPAAPGAPLGDFQPLADDMDTTASSADGGQMLLVIGGGIAVVLIGGLIGFFVTRRRPEQG